MCIEQFQTGTHDLLHGFYDRLQDFIWHNFIRPTGQTAFKGLSPRDPQLGTDVDDVDSSGNCMREISVICSRTAVQGEKDP